MTLSSTITLMGLFWSAAVPLAPLLFAQASPPPTTTKKKNKLGVTNCQGKSSRRCTVDPSLFNPKFLAGDVIDVDFGPGRRYKCHSKGQGGSSTCSTVETSLFGGASVVGDMNVVTRGKNSRGENYIFGSTSVGLEICDFSPDATGMNTIVECSLASEYPPESDAIEVSVPDKKTTLNNSLLSTIHSRSSSLPHQHRSLVPDDLGGNIDVMVVWTKKAECKKSGLAVNCTLTNITENNMRGLIDLAVAETNTAYVLSGVTTQLRLVHAYREPNYVEATTDAFYVALSAMQSKNDGIMDDVHDKRDLHGADIVAMIIDDEQYCGMAYMGPRSDLMFSVTAWHCATGYYTFGHEVAHNMGCNHDRGTTNACASNESNYGWRDPSAEFRSILAYNCVTSQCDNISSAGCPRVQRFSNNVYLYNGKAMGSSQHDNASQINSVKSIIAAYRPVVADPPATTPQPTSSLTIPITAVSSATVVPVMSTTSPTPVPPKPSTSPTNNLEPSTSPTAQPTISPTHFPSTLAPTPAPTTISPTSTTTPTTTPTSKPSTARPTTTRIPTVKPTLQPLTAKPSTTKPSRMPTRKPTRKPATQKKR